MKKFLWILPVLILSACAIVDYPRHSTVDPQSDAKSCVEEIGGDAATQLAHDCRMASPATHPPCNVQNSCAMMRAEIVRACGLFNDMEQCGNHSNK